MRAPAGRRSTLWAAALLDGLLSEWSRGVGVPGGPPAYGVHPLSLSSCSIWRGLALEIAVTMCVVYLFMLPLKAFDITNITGLLGRAATLHGLHHRPELPVGHRCT